MVPCIYSTDTVQYPRVNSSSYRLSTGLSFRYRDRRYSIVLLSRYSELTSVLHLPWTHGKFPKMHCKIWFRFHCRPPRLHPRHSRLPHRHHPVVIVTSSSSQSPSCSSFLPLRFLSSSFLLSSLTVVSLVIDLINLHPQPDQPLRPETYCAFLPLQF